MALHSPASLPLVVVVMGVSGCGKTEVGEMLARELGYEFHDADHFHPPENVALMSRGIALQDAQRAPWLDSLAGFLDTAISERRGIVLACSALKRSYRSRIGAGRPEVRLVHLDGPEDLIRERLEQRTGHFMPASLLASQCALLERPTDDEKPIRIDIAPAPDEIVRQIVAAVGRG